jgi:uncharacterized protein
MNGTEMSPWLIAALCPFFVAVAAAYGAVGLGGGSGYVAIMVLAGIPQASIPSTALILNIGVTGMALLRYGFAGRVKLGILIPFLMPAIPAAFVGGIWQGSHRSLDAVLAAVLLVAAVLTLRPTKSMAAESQPPQLWKRLAVGIPCGVGIGIVAGLVGIGGGVFAGPVILALRWASPKEVAAMNALLVLALSVAGLLGHRLRGAISLSLVAPFVVATLLGGLLGAHVAERRLSQSSLQKIFAAIILIAGAKALFDALR